MRVLGVIMGAMVVTACSAFGDRSGTEQASYEVVTRLGENTEVRRYPALVVAETTVAASDEEAGRNTAFRALFKYIDGGNRAQSKVAMTAPVETAAGAQKIDMTAPVETQTSDAGEYSMRFFLPAEYTIETAPQPTDPDVRIVEVPERTVAVLRFSGSRGTESVERQTQALATAVDRSAWRTDGEAFALFYDPPWTLPFLRRNEVAVPVTAGR